MKNGSLRDVVQFIRHITPPGRMDDAPDGQLLERFIDCGDETAFAALLRRHGPLVLAVCRRALPCAEDAEDAFQATFLVLARNAGSIAKRGSVASWLHGVAHRIARRAQADIAKRRVLERRGRPPAAPDSLHELVWQDLRSILDEEVSRLPEKYRAAFVLCHLEGTSNEEAARHLGCPRGTVSSRLVRARAILRERLTRRGLALSAVFMTATLSGSMTSAALPEKLAGATLRAALQVGPRGLADGAVISAQVITLMEGGLKTMTRLKLAAILLLPLGMVVAGTGALTLTKAPAEPAVVTQENPRTGVNTSPEEPPDPPEPPVPATVEPPVDPAEKYLGLCEKKLKSFDSFVAQVQRTSTNRTFEISDTYDGTLKYLKPGMSLWEAHKKGKPQIIEKYVLTGPFLYEYDSMNKKVRVHALPREPLFVPFFLPVKPTEMRRSFHCKLVKEDQWYIYIGLTPRTPETKAAFQRARLVLMKQTYLPRELWLEQRNEKEIKWDIRKTEVNVPLPREEFTKPKIPQGWKLERLPQETESLPTREVPPPDDPPKHWAGQGAG